MEYISYVLYNYTLNTRYAMYILIIRRTDPVAGWEFPQVLDFLLRTLPPSYSAHFRLHAYLIKSFKTSFLLSNA